MQLRVADTLEVQAGGRIDVSANGFKGSSASLGWSCETRGANGQATTAGASTGRSGGSYGSLGLNHSGSANNLYGSEIAPVDLGSGGSHDCCSNYGGNGGGRVEIETGRLIVDGLILANGGDGSGGGGGSGGSIWLRIAGGNIAGNGIIQAEGGRGLNNGGYGGGGRIAITGFANNSFAGKLGRAGTVFLQQTGGIGQLILDTTTLAIGAGESKTFDSILATTNGACYLTNRGTLLMAQDHLFLPSGVTLFQEGVIKGANRASNYIGSITVATNALITHFRGSTNGVQLRVVNTLEIQAGGRIDVSTNGFKGSSQPLGWVCETRGTNGQATNSGASNGRSGGSHGSLGLNHSGSANNLYGSEIAPVDLGSGGSHDCCSNYGGNGGGRVEIETGRLIVDGLILANGGDGSGGGGGSGGSIWLRIAGGNLEGNGIIQAEGGRGLNDGGFGGGGRIAITGFATNSFAGKLGRAGTVFLQQTGAIGQLILDTTTLAIGVGETKTFDSITATTNGACYLTNRGTLVLGLDRWTVPGGMTLFQEGVVKGATRASNYIGSLTVASNALITHFRGSTNGVQLRVVGTLEIQAGGRIDVSTNGFKGSSQPLGWSCETRGTNGQATTAGASTGRSGGSYGSTGLNYNGAPNNLYGSEIAPVDLGSGGSHDCCNFYGGNGGGRVEIETGRLIVDGLILANGGDGSGGGGGSGGSIWLRIAGGNIEGSGVIEAEGGRGLNGAGFGGGGRIAITGFAENSFEGKLGRAGTVFLQQTGAIGQLILDTTTLAIGVGETKTFDSIMATTNGVCYLTNRGTLLMAQDHLLLPPGVTLFQEGVVKGANRASNYIGSITVASNALITHFRGNTNGVQLRVVNALEIQEGGKIDVSANGFKGSSASLGWSCETRGTDGQATTTGASTGRSGGSYGSFGFNHNGIANQLYGSEMAPAELGSGGSHDCCWNYGGNGGGRVEIEAGSLLLEGAILANGGNGSDAGGGSGGAIWVRLAGGDFAGTGLLQAEGGRGTNGGFGGGGRIAITGYANNAFLGKLGRAGTLFLQQAGSSGHLILDTTVLNIPQGESKTYDSIAATTNGITYITNRGSLIFATDTVTVPSGVVLYQEGIIKGVNRASNYIGSLTVASNALITHVRGNTNGVQLRVANALAIESGGRIDVSTCGLKGGNANLGWTAETWGANGAPTGSGRSTGRSGGSYGGLGAASSGIPNALYGRSNAPVELGSGGSYDCCWNYGGNGGGRLEIEAGRLTVDGLMLANGGNGSDGGGGSGGAIWLRINDGDLLGTGLIQAIGGRGTNAGVGGGGRIAITGFNSNFFAGTIEAANGTLYLGAGIRPPLITRQPISQTVLTGDSVSFLVQVTGSAPLNYQWRRNGSDLNAQTDSTLTLTNAQIADLGSYTVVVTNLAGAVTSLEAFLAVEVGVRMAEARLLTPTQFHMLLRGAADRPCVLEYSTDLTRWFPVLTNTVADGRLDFTETINGSTRSKFYRATILP